MSKNEAIIFFDEEIRPLYSRLLEHMAEMLPDPEQCRERAQDVMAMAWARTKELQQTGDLWGAFCALAEERLKS